MTAADCTEYGPVLIHLPTMSSVRYGDAQPQGVPQVHEAGEANGRSDGLHHLRHYAQLGHDLQNAHRGNEALEEGAARKEEERGTAEKEK